MIVNTKVMLNSIFHPESERIIKDRIDYALNKEGQGKNFWEHFFRCDTDPKCYAKNKWIITYLFTEQQLGILKAWWAVATKDYCPTLKKNIIDSEIFLYDPEHPPQYLGEFILPIHACCITSLKSEKHPTVERLLFGKSKVMKLPPKTIDFFGEEIFNVPTEQLARPDEGKILFGVVDNIMSKIEACFPKYGRRITLKIKGGKYFLYLGRDCGAYQWLEYCKDVDADCPLVQKNLPYFTTTP